MPDLAIASEHAAPTMPLATVVGTWLNRLSALCPVSRSACPAASELAGIARIDGYDVAPWLSF